MEAATLRTWVALGLAGVAVAGGAVASYHFGLVPGEAASPPAAASGPAPASGAGGPCLGGNETLAARAGFLPGELNATMVVREASWQNVSIDPTTALAVAALARGGVAIDPQDFYDRETRRAEVCEMDREARLDPDSVSAALALGRRDGAIVDLVGETRRFVLVEHTSFQRVRIGVDTALAALALDRATNGSGVDPLAIATFDRDASARRVEERSGRVSEADALLAVAFRGS
ncbi:MAG TPA: hypothetical protein VM889_08705 [Candidatus Thermoplasmatota archaeon]|nr:hypothetical protein [Candidatus Thermoplasmatota archaeon]